MTELPFAGKVAFFVYIVESPSAVDIYHKRSESDLLQNVLELEGIPSVARLAISRSAFYAALTIGIAEEMKNLSERIPIIHLSSHGNDGGIGLSSGEVLNWDELRRLLVPINKALDGKLLVAMSCCDGYSGIRMAMTANPSDDLPFAAIVGSAGSPTWSDSAVAFSTFYHLIRKGAYLVDAVKAMQTASGVDDFFLNMGESVRKNYIAYLESLDATAVRQEIESASEDTQRTEPDAMAKAAEFEPSGGG